MVLYQAKLTRFRAKDEVIRKSLNCSTGFSTSCWIYRTVLKSPWKLHLSWKVLEKLSKALKSPWILPFKGGFNTVFGYLNQYKFVVSLFGAAYAAPNKGTTILYLFSKTNTLSKAAQHFQSRILMCKSVFFKSFQTFKTVGTYKKSLKSPWIVHTLVCMNLVLVSIFSSQMHNVDFIP